jgi:mono/diheme cytochrome c family protein
MTSKNCKLFSRKVLSIFSLLFITTINLSFAQSVELGEGLFSSNCASCHYLGPEDKKLIGPGLDAHIMEEFSTEWLYSWIRNSSELIASGDEQAIATYEEFNKTQMTAFPQFSNEDIDNILAYIQAGPVEVVATTGGNNAVAVDTAASSESMMVLFVALAILFLSLMVLIRVKNVLKEAKGEKTTTLVQGAGSWLKKNPVVIVLFVIFMMLYGGKVIFEGLLIVGVQQGYQPEQPIAFSHKIHAGENGIDCNYCHSGARHSKTSGVPSANVCMNCHTYINSGTNTGTEEISKIYTAIGFDPETRTYIEGYEQQPIEWVRIHNLPDLAYYNHSQHVNVAGLECQTCHGPVEEMDVVEQYSPLTMGWCVDCHKETKVDMDNPYYHDLNENWVEKYHGEEMTVDKIGGLECGKCHY